MAKEIIKFDYNGNQIPFENGSNVMVNLTAMAKAYPDKNLTQIVNSQEIKEYCASLSKLQNYSLADLCKLGVEEIIRVLGRTVLLLSVLPKN